MKSHPHLVFSTALLLFALTVNAQTQSNPAIKKAMEAVSAAAPTALADPDRPQYHFHPPAQWMNDPNGPMFYKGYYHLFYQHNPYGDKWDHMHWGHARSKDLVRWEHLPIALWPSLDKGEAHCFSGCMTLDGAGKPMIFYTSIGHPLPEQWAASPVDDDLLVWEKHPKNPILTEALHGDQKIHEWRDPYAFEADGRRFMVVGGNVNASKGGGASVMLYEAKNSDLTEWTYRGVMFTHPDQDATNIECPNFVKVGDEWVLIVSPHRSVEYFVGKFDPDKGIFASTTRGIVDYGDFYAPNGLYQPNGPHVLWGWVRGFPEGKGWNGCLSLPRALNVNGDGTLVQTPVRETRNLRQDRVVRVKGQILDLDLGVKCDASHIEIGVESPLEGTDTIEITLPRGNGAGENVVIRLTQTQLEVAGVTVPLVPKDKTDLSLFIDHSVVEIYANDGTRCITKVIAPGISGNLIRIKGKVESLLAWQLE